MSRYRSYWTGTGTHQAEFKRLRAALVPVGGAAATPQGELLRAVGRLYYHAMANGLRNIEAGWREWQAVQPHRDQLAAAIGPQGTWVIAVVDRAVTERYEDALRGERPALKKVPQEAFEKLLDSCVLTVRALQMNAGPSEVEPDDVEGISQQGANHPAPPRQAVA